MADEQGTDRTQIAVRTMHFGDILYTDETDSIIADVGDVQLLIIRGEASSFATLTPQQALEVAENLIKAANKGMDYIKEYEKEMGK